MRITIKRWGNSAGMVIPNIVMKELNLQPGQSVEAQVSNNQLILTPISRRYSLDELLAQCDMNAAELSEQDVWDIVLVGFDPASGHEQQGAGRPALVLSVQAFNQLGMTLVAPITQGGNFARYAGFSVPLHCEEGDVHGVVLVNQVRMMDLRARLAKRIGLAADEVVEEALLRLQAVVE
ncbi:PemK and Antitoxin-MazE domain containing protein [Trichuris trichiura]|nr:PemK and Antitoxin-MazE domain containing protein [Trichuris trichiura]